MDALSGIDSSLVERAKRGSSTALTRLLYLAGTRYETVIAKKVPKDFRSVVEADDIIQIARTRALKQFCNFESDDPNAFLKWFRMIAENALQTEIRALRAMKRGGNCQRVNETYASFLIEELSSDTPSPRQTIERDEIILAVKSNIDGLPTTQRKAIRLHHIDDRSVLETAEILGKPPGTVRGILDRAKKTLKRAMGNSSKWFST